MYPIEPLAMEANNTYTATTPNTNNVQNTINIPLVILDAIFSLIYICDAQRYEILFNEQYIQVWLSDTLYRFADNFCRISDKLFASPG